MKASKRFFFVKKNQKTFIRWAVTFPDWQGPTDESFLLLFYKKEDLASFRPADRT